MFLQPALVLLYDMSSHHPCGSHFFGETEVLIHSAIWRSILSDSFNALAHVLV